MINQLLVAIIEPEFVNLSFDDILYIEAEKDYCRIHTDQKNYPSNYGIGVMEQRMDPTQFFRIHRSFLVNINHIKDIGYVVGKTMEQQSSIVNGEKR